MVDSISYLEDLYSCGGCETMGSGVDCTAIQGGLAVSCSLGLCHGECSLLPLFQGLRLLTPWVADGLLDDQAFQYIVVN
jgi:hypothetical protein